MRKLSLILGILLFAISVTFPSESDAKHQFRRFSSLTQRQMTEEGDRNKTSGRLEAVENPGPNAQSESWAGRPLDEVIKEVRSRIENHRTEIVNFLREIVAIPSMDSQIGPVGRRVAEEMKALGFDRVWFDRMGNVIGKFGSGSMTILFDSHIDTVGVGNLEDWQWDPFKGKTEDGIFFGRGTCDEKGSTPGMIYGLAIMKQMGLLDAWTAYYFGNMEEWCDGIAPNVLVEMENIRPDYVVIGEPTDMKVYCGHRGRIELECVAKGRSSHASMPQLGDNAVYKIARFVQAVKEWNQHIREDEILGKGTVVVSRIWSESASINTVPAECRIWIDRRLTLGETKESAIAELKRLPGAEDIEIHEMYYDTPSYMGFVFKVDKYFPAWREAQDSPLVQAAVATASQLWGKPVALGYWNFSTNGIYWAGKAGIPTIGFGPGNEIHAHTIEEQVPLGDVVRAAEFYALLPKLLEKSCGETDLLCNNLSAEQSVALGSSFQRILLKKRSDPN
jgi:putative selenium metabolism hydrolase